ncbi:dehydrogenase/reductase SDR family member 1-like protein [Aphelenchoides avenae]|nr:dehydrogenase/reductase SDR family member 1-like protein [Aphelenchus avenae]
MPNTITTISINGSESIDAKNPYSASRKWEFFSTKNGISRPLFPSWRRYSSTTAVNSSSHPTDTEFKGSRGMPLNNGYSNGHSSNTVGRTNGYSNGHSAVNVKNFSPKSDKSLSPKSSSGVESSADQPLKGWVALVTGSSRGIGKGIALQLGEAGATVYVTGRPPHRRSELQQSLGLPMLEETALEVSHRGGTGVAVYCDHSDPEQVKELFRRIDREQRGRIDILVNNAQSNVDEHIHTDRRFYEYPVEFFEETNSVALTNHYICSVLATRLMIPRRKGLIVTISSGGGINFLFNTVYGKDRMAADMAQELKDKGITSVCIHVGPVKTEAVKLTVLDPEKPVLNDIFGQGESIEFTGKCIIALATDPKLMKRSGRILSTTEIAKDYDLHDLDGSQPSCPVYTKWKDFYEVLNDVRTKTAL